MLFASSDENLSSEADRGEGGGGMTPISVQLKQALLPQLYAPLWVCETVAERARRRPPAGIKASQCKPQAPFVARKLAVCRGPGAAGFVHCIFVRHDIRCRSRGTSRPRDPEGRSFRALALGVRDSRANCWDIWTAPDSLLSATRAFAADVCSVVPRLSSERVRVSRVRETYDISLAIFSDANDSLRSRCNCLY